MKYLGLKPLDKVEIFNWHVNEIDGHNFERNKNILTANKTRAYQKHLPTIILYGKYPILAWNVAMKQSD